MASALAGIRIDGRTTARILASGGKNWAPWRYAFPAPSAWPMLNLEGYSSGLAAGEESLPTASITRRPSGAQSAHPADRSGGAFRAESESAGPFGYGKRAAYAMSRGRIVSSGGIGRVRNANTEQPRQRSLTPFATYGRKRNDARRANRIGQAGRSHLRDNRRN